MTNPKPVPTGPAGDPSHRAVENDLSALHVTAGAHLWQRVGITAAAHTDHASFQPDPDVLLGHLSVVVDQGSGGGLHLVIDNPQTAQDLADALTWAATRLRELIATAAPGSEWRAFGLADPARRRGLPAAPAADTTTATEEAA